MNRKKVLLIATITFLVMTVLISQTVSSQSIESVSVTGVFRQDEDSKWRCYANITITNSNEENVTLSWIYLNALNVTYVDETSEELGISGNSTVNQVLQPGENITASWTITEFGFYKEPKILWVTVKASILESETPITLTTVIPEFPSFLILPLFMIATLLAVIVYRRKHTM